MRSAAHSPVIDALLVATDGLAVVLNAERQIVAFNHAWLAALGADEPEHVLGLRPGEALRCSHAQDEPGGCGTSRACASCGAALAIVGCQREGAPQEMDCVLTVEREGQPVELDLAVKTSPLSVPDRRFTLVLLRDVTGDRRRALLERAFFHGVSNLIMGLLGTAQALAEVPQPPGDGLVDDVHVIARRLSAEVALQRALAGDSEGYILRPERVSLDRLLADCVASVRHHPAAREHTLLLSAPGAAVSVETDRWLLERVITNLLINACEAEPAPVTIEVRASDEQDRVRIAVHNPGKIPDASLPRIFQRFFSTKTGSGRGQGLSTVKHLTEQVLGGTVAFQSSAEKGTSFTVILPVVHAGRGVLPSAGADVR